MIELCEDADGVGVGEESPFRVAVHSVDEMFNSHLGGSIAHRWESHAHFFWEPLNSLRGEVG